MESENMENGEERVRLERGDEFLTKLVNYGGWCLRQRVKTHIYRHLNPRAIRLGFLETKSFKR